MLFTLGNPSQFSARGNWAISRNSLGNASGIPPLITGLQSGCFQLSLSRNRGGKLSAIKLKEIAGGKHWGIKDRPGFTNLAAIVFLDSLIQDGFLVFITFVMIEKQVSTGLVAFAVAGTLSGGIFGKYAGGLLAARIGVIRSIVFFEVLTSIGIMLVFFVPGNSSFFLLPLVLLALR